MSSSEGMKKRAKKMMGPGPCTNKNCPDPYLINQKRSVCGFGYDCGCAISHLRKRREENTKPGKCIKCGKKVSKRDIFGQGYDCGCVKSNAINASNKNLESIKNGGNCIKCGKYNKKLNINHLGWECGCAQKHIDSIEKGFKFKYCEICNKETRHIGNRCCICNPIETGNHIQYCSKCNKDTLHNGNRCSQCNPWEIPQVSVRKFIDENDCLKHKNCFISYYSNNKYKCWECFKEEKLSILSSLDLDINNFAKEVSMQIIPTFLSQDDTNWKNARSAFEQYLVDLEVKYFTYIKYGISKDNKVFPLAVCKSGSLLVNKGGSDVRFGYNGDDPARKFLRETNTKWMQEFISIKSFDTEKESLDYESKLLYEYNLFS